MRWFIFLAGVKWRVIAKGFYAINITLVYKFSVSFCHTQSNSNRTCSHNRFTLSLYHLFTFIASHVLVVLPSLFSRKDPLRVISVIVLLLWDSPFLRLAFCLSSSCETKKALDASVPLLDPLSENKGRNRRGGQRSLPRGRFQLRRYALPAISLHRPVINMKYQL